MGYVIFGATTIICGLGWLNQYVCSAALISWMLENKISLPGEELKDHLRWAWKKVLRIK